MSTATAQQNGNTSDTSTTWSGGSGEGGRPTNSDTINLNGKTILLDTALTGITLQDLAGGGVLNCTGSTNTIAGWTIQNTATATVLAGSYTQYNPGTLSISGILNIAGTGTLYWAGGTGPVALNAGGQINVASGGVFRQYSGLTLSVSGTLTIASGGIWTPYSGAVTINSGGVVTVAGVGNAGIAGQTLTITIASGGTLTISTGYVTAAAGTVNLVVSGTLNNTDGIARTGGTFNYTHNTGATVSNFGTTNFVAGDSTDPGEANVASGTAAYKINGVTKSSPSYPTTAATTATVQAADAATLSAKNLNANGLDTAVDFGASTGYAKSADCYMAGLGNGASAQLSTDQAAVLTQAADIWHTATILGQAGAKYASSITNCTPENIKRTVTIDDVSGALTTRKKRGALR